jgi:hypothetical protein
LFGVMGEANRFEVICCFQPRTSPDGSCKWRHHVTPSTSIAAELRQLDALVPCSNFLLREATTLQLLNIQFSNSTRSTAQRVEYRVAMSLRLAARRLGLPGTQKPPSISLTLPIHLHHMPCLTASPPSGDVLSLPPNLNRPPPNPTTPLQMGRQHLQRLEQSRLQGLRPSRR